MATLTKKIGLSLGADICWPLCYEEIMKKLDLNIRHRGDSINFEVERVSIEPFDLQQPCKYNVVLDRLTHWYHPSREWIKKSVIMDDLYVLNNPWAVQSMEKQTSYCAMMRLGLPIPKTWLIPPKAYEPSADLQPTLHRYARLFDLGEIGDKVGYPHFMKPYDGGGWVGVNCIKSADDLRETYEQSGKFVMHLQKGVIPHDFFVRCIGLGPQVHMVKYDPGAPLHARYTPGDPGLGEADRKRLEDYTLLINAFFLWDFNSCESLRKDGEWFPIDFANPCPDSQVTSLNWHFPWIVQANIRWSTYCAATGRKVRMNHNWEPYFKIAAKDISFEEKLEGYMALARKHFEVDKFQSFCDKNLKHLDEVTFEFFRTEKAKEAVRQKVAALFPEHEVEQFTEHFWAHIQQWCHDHGG